MNTRSVTIFSLQPSEERSAQIFPGRYIRLIAASVLLSFGAASAQAAGDHWDLPSCYISVHDGCFNQGSKCSREDYKEFLKDCDDQYSKAVAIPKPAYSTKLSGHMKKYVGRSR